MAKDKKIEEMSLEELQALANTQALQIEDLSKKNTALEKAGETKDKTIADLVSANAETNTNSGVETFTHKGNKYVAIGPKFYLDGKIKETKDLKNNKDLIAQCVELNILIPVEEAEVQ